MAPIRLYELEPDHQQTLLSLARETLCHGLRHGRPLTVDATPYSDPLRRPGASFVTLKHRDSLRGCVGTLEAYRPLVCDVAGQAFAAAFEDPRFPALERNQLEQLGIGIAVLSPLEELAFADESSLLAQLRPGLDGLILQKGAERATFLPAMWQALPDKQVFVWHLKEKLGLQANGWHADMRAWRYSAQAFELRLLD